MPVLNLYFVSTYIYIHIFIYRECLIDSVQPEKGANLRCKEKEHHIIDDAPDERKDVKHLQARSCYLFTGFLYLTTPA